MKLEYCGAYHYHGLHTIHDSQDLRRATKGQWPTSDRRSVLASDTQDGLLLRFDGTGNLNTNACYELRLSMSDEELLDLFEMRFGLETSVLDIKKEIFEKLVKQHAISGGLSPRIPRLPPPA
jgi:hypothetical protein